MRWKFFFMPLLSGSSEKSTSFSTNTCAHAPRAPRLQQARTQVQGVGAQGAAGARSRHPPQSGRAQADELAAGRQSARAGGAPASLPRTTR